MTISKSIRKPGSYSEIDAAGANNALPSTRQETVFIAPMLAAGTKAANQPFSVSSGNQAAEFWGAGSIMHRMVRAAFKKNPYLVLTGVGLEDAGAGIAATSTLTFAGKATAPGTVTYKCGIDVVSIAYATDDDADAVVAALAAEIAKYTMLPVTADASTALLTLTAKNKGTCGNYLGKYNASDEKYYPEVIITGAGITVAVTGFSSGETDPDMTTAYAALVSKRYHLYAIPFATLAAAQDLDEHLELVSDEINQKGARGFMFISGAVADATTISAANAKRICLGTIRRVFRPQFENAAVYAAVQAAEETPWRAINDEILTDCDVPDIADRFTDTEINNLLWNGVTPFYVSGERVRCVRSVSMYTKDDTDTPDSVWLDSFKIATADYVREAIVNSHKSNFRNCSVRDNHVDGEPDGIITPADVVDNNIAVCKRIEKAGGLNNVDAYLADFVSERDSDVPGRINSMIPIDIVDAAHIFANTIKITSSV